ncbi:uncharacterized protein BO66DRAFT_144855 [Aspergillus aculeatinus CBS 121060]|uniref:Uncharacterized protein n=1 Tax=Aspergillus aculeatinus CBS 121060 TaxID=1448322 RepID=A0ACD1HLB2_9EURO|nr:hypothetical protein BO66DRAFT_144855 [Aspergillus aculeatinus CBS 121060]RAH74236.1 hypothetical protein BO66DRAFT_144855 [Aspergillus aculeatinus CBS 121060]
MGRWCVISTGCMELLLFGVRYTGGAESSPAWPATAMPMMHHWHIEFLPDVELLNMTGFRLPVFGFRRSSFWILTAFDQRQKKRISRDHWQLSLLLLLSMERIDTAYTRHSLVVCSGIATPAHCRKRCRWYM